MQQAERSCNYIEFTDIMHRLLKAAWGSKWGTFCEAFPNGRDAEDVELPMITFRIVSKVPAPLGKDGTREIKPRFRQTFDLPNTIEGGPEVVNVYSQTFDYQVMFEVWHESNSKADQLADRFEEFMMAYTGYMMSQGVRQIIFVQMIGDDGSYQLRDRAVCRHYQYLVRLEKHVEIPSYVIKEVLAKVSVTHDISEDQDQDKESIVFKSQ